MISSVALIDVHPFPCEYGINEQLRIILNGLQDLDALSTTNAREDRHIPRSDLQNRVTTLQTISQELGMFAACQISAPAVRQDLQQSDLSAW